MPSTTLLLLLLLRYPFAHSTHPDTKQRIAVHDPSRRCNERRRSVTYPERAGDLAFSVTGQRFEGSGGGGVTHRLSNGSSAGKV